MMYTLIVHPDAQADLEDLWATDTEAAARITVFLEECEGDQDLLDRFTQHDYGFQHTAAFHVSQWFAQQHKGRNLWRVKVWELDDRHKRYRIVYAFQAQRHRYHVLAIAPRDFNYDEKHPITQRIIRACQELL